MKDNVKHNCKICNTKVLWYEMYQKIVNGTYEKVCYNCKYSK